MKKAILGALAITAMTVVQASAATIDFSSAVWNPGGDDSITVGNTTVESIPQIPLATLSWDSSKGLGVTSWWNPAPQIGTLEAIEITFSQPFYLTGFFLTDLGFLNTGYYSVNGGNWQSVSGQIGGNVSVSLASVPVTSLVFGYDGATLSNFRVKSLNGEFRTQDPPAVPEPTSMVLLGTGLLGLVARARRARA